MNRGLSTVCMPPFTFFIAILFIHFGIFLRHPSATRVRIEYRGHGLGPQVQLRYVQGDLRRFAGQDPEVQEEAVE